MKRILLSLSLCLLAGTALKAQITISAADMPRNGDKLGYSVSLPSAGLNLSNTGASIAWDYTSLTAQAQRVDTYRTVTEAGYNSGSGIGANAFGYRFTDTLTFPSAPVTLNDVYTFFSLKTGPDRFVAEGFAGRINGAIPIAAPYSDEDEWYFFPLTFGRNDSSSFSLTTSVLGMGTLKMNGWRKTNVDGWGTITTPSHTSPVPVLRVRSEVNEMDTITYLTQNFVINRHYVDYKWLANGVHYPMLWVTASIISGNETPTSVTWRDSRGLGIGGRSAAALQELTVFPNPAAGAEVRVKIPASWHSYATHVFDATGKLLSRTSNTATIQTGSLPAGTYTIIVESNGQYGAARFTK